MSKEINCDGCVRQDTPDVEAFISICMTCKRAYRQDTKYFKEMFKDKYEAKEEE